MSVETSANEVKERRRKEKKKMKEQRIEEDVVVNGDNDSVTTQEKVEKRSSNKNGKAKKRQRDADDDDENREANGGNRAEVDGEMISGKLTARKKKRKSVTFAESVDVQEENRVDVSTGNIDGLTLEEEDDDREKRKREKREKREQRRKSKNNNTSEGEDKNITMNTISESESRNDGNPILAYLSQYYNDRAAWKFQKIREAHLLKHVFSLEQVPSEYNPALLTYLKGLKSEGARSRLRKSAQDIIKLDERMTTASTTQDGGGDGGGTTTDETSDIAKLPVLPESWRESYSDAVYHFKGNLNAGVKDLNEGVSLAAPVEDGNEKEEPDTNILTRLEIRKRAELVLWTVSGKIGKVPSSANKVEKTAETDVSETPLPKSNPKGGDNKQKAQTRKKRKNRTMIVEISSSESSSESDSD